MRNSIVHFVFCILHFHEMGSEDGYDIDGCMDGNWGVYIWFFFLFLFFAELMYFVSMVLVGFKVMAQQELFFVIRYTLDIDKS